MGAGRCRNVVQPAKSSSPSWPVYANICTWSYNCLFSDFPPISLHMLQCSSAHTHTHTHTLSCLSTFIVVTAIATWPIFCATDGIMFDPTNCTVSNTNNHLSLMFLLHVSTSIRSSSWKCTQMHTSRKNSDKIMCLCVCVCVCVCVLCRDKIQGDQKVCVRTWWLQCRSQVHRDFLITLYNIG